MQPDDAQTAIALLAKRVGAIEILLQNLYVRYFTEQTSDALREIRKSIDRLNQERYYVPQIVDNSGALTEKEIQQLLVDFFGHVMSIVEAIHHNKSCSTMSYTVLTPESAGTILRKIAPTLHFDEVEQVDVVEAASDAVFRIWLAAGQSPHSLILKKRGDNPLRNHMVDAYHLFDREVYFYQHLASQVSLGLPRCLYASPTEQVLLLQDCGQFVTGDQEAGYEPEEALSVMHQMAIFHRNSVDIISQSRPPLPAVNDASVVAILPNMVEQVWNQIGGLLGKDVPFADKIVRSLIQQIPELAGQLADEPCTLIHGDLRLENLLFDVMELKVVLDWQLLSLGSPMLDVAYFLSQSGEKTAREKVEKQVIDIYTKLFSNLGYTQDRIHSEYRAGLLYSLIIPIFGAASDLQQQKPIRPLVLSAFRRSIETLNELN